MMPGAATGSYALLIHLGFDQTPMLQLVAGALGLALLALLGVGAAAAREGGLSPLGLERDRLGNAVREGLCAWLMVLPLVVALQLGMRALADRFHWSIAPNPAALRFLATNSAGELFGIGAIALVLAPLSEEALFRGLLLPALRRRMGMWPAAWLSALLFALVHPPIDMPAILALGVALALAFEHSGSVLAPLTAHLANNLYGLAALALQRYLAYG